MSSLYQRNNVSGVTRSAISLRLSRHNAFAFAARRRRWSSVKLRRRAPSCSRSTRFSSFRYSITSNPIGDLRPLSGLTSLKRLVMNHAALSGLTSLEVLGLDHNRIRDISALADLDELRTLSLSFNQISDVSPVATLASLETFRAGHNEIGDIGPLAGLERLRELHLEANQIDDIAALSGNAELRRMFSWPTKSPTSRHWPTTVVSGRAIAYIWALIPSTARIRLSSTTR